MCLGTVVVRNSRSTRNTQLSLIQIDSQVGIDIDDEHKNNMTGTCRFPPLTANGVVRTVNNHVNVMIGDSTVVEGQWETNDDKFGIFEKGELQLGKVLGSGGFADVYEILKFEPKYGVRNAFSSSYSSKQMAARKQLCENNVTIDGKSKYVVKHLKVKNMEDPIKFCMAAADLVVEAHFLSSLNHDNILKIRGWATGGIEAYAEGHHDGYFLILDRLSETLADRIESWRKQKSDSTLEMSFQRLGLENDVTAQLLSRTKIVHQIAKALQYLHSKNIVFRDLKPNNVGFDEYGTVKIFDFGLSRELPQPCVNVNDTYHMSGKVGTVRFMAPEVALSKEYNQKVDTYSWSMLYWNCITLEKPYAEMSRSAHSSLVCVHGLRPVLTKAMPDCVKDLLTKSWAHCMETRLTMAKVCEYLECIEKELHSGLAMARSNSFRASTQPTFQRNISATLVSMAA